MERLLGPRIRGRFRRWRLAPAVRLVLLAPGVIELHQPLLRFPQAYPGLRGNRFLTGFQPLVALEEQRFGRGVILDR
jgi:hypothetical protein